MNFRPLSVLFLLSVFRVCSCSEEDTLASLTAALPPPLGYWPLNRKFGAHDASPNKLHAVFRSPQIVAVDGPFAGPVKTGYTFGTDNETYLEFARPEFANLGDASFTLSMFVRVIANTSHKVAPFVEFPMQQPSFTAYGLNLWMWPNQKTLQLSTISSGDALLLPCAFHHDWAFIGAVYDNDTQTIQSFCNSTFSPATSTADGPLTGPAGFIVGKSSPIPGMRDSISADGEIAGLSIYKKALTKDEIIGKVYKLGLKYAVEPCKSSKCLPETCQATSDDGLTFACQCEGGDCDATTTKLPDLKTKKPEPQEQPSPITEKPKCKAGWADYPGCNTPVCQTPCPKGTNCTAPDTCSPISEHQAEGMKKSTWLAIIIIIAIIIIVLIVILVYCCIKKRKQQNSTVNEASQKTDPESVPLKQQETTQK